VREIEKTPQAFSSMNSPPAPSNARRTAKSLAAIIAWRGRAPAGIVTPSWEVNFSWSRSRRRSPSNGVPPSPKWAAAHGCSRSKLRGRSGRAPPARFRPRPLGWGARRRDLAARLRRRVALPALPGDRRRQRGRWLNEDVSQGSTRTYLKIAACCRSDINVE
jgi:hypothetical protein